MAEEVHGWVLATDGKAVPSEGRKREAFRLIALLRIEVEKDHRGCVVAWSKTPHIAKFYIL